MTVSTAIGVERRADHGFTQMLAQVFPFTDMTEAFGMKEIDVDKPWYTRLWDAANDILLGLDFIDFLRAIGVMTFTRIVLRAATNKKVDPVFHCHYYPWEVSQWLFYTADKYLKQYGIQTYLIAASHTGYWVLVGSHQHKWAMEVIHRTVRGQRPVSWKEKRERA